FWFYAVNRERYAVKVRIEISGATQVSDAADGDARTLSAGALELELAPYELAAFRARAGAAIRAVRVEPPRTAVEQVTAQVRWIPERAAHPPLIGLSAPQRALLERAAEEATRALCEGRLWRARALLEAAPLLEVYRALGERPPGLRDAVVMP